MVVVNLRDIMSGSMMFENILSIRVLELLVMLVGCKIKGINELDASECKSSLVALCSLCIIQKIDIKISKQEDRF